MAITDRGGQEQKCARRVRDFFPSLPRSVLSAEKVDERILQSIVQAAYEMTHTNNSILKKLEAAICLLLIIIAFRSTFPVLADAYMTDEYSHGLIIPFLALLLGVNLLTREPKQISCSWLGIGALGIAGVLLLIGRLAAFATAAEYGLIAGLIGLSLAFLGMTITAVLAPAFGYLLFAVPLPHLAYATLSQDLQLLSSTLGVSILDLSGISVFQEGNVIDLGGMKLQVAEACNGLRYLFPLLSFSYIVAYLLQDRLWKRVVIFISAIPIAIGINALRIALIGITVAIWGNRMAGGLLHNLEGWIIFLICVVSLLLEMILLSKLKPVGCFRLEYLSLPRGEFTIGRTVKNGPQVSAIVFSACLAALFSNGLIDDRIEATANHPPFSAFPVKIKGWQGHAEVLAPDILASLQLSDYWLADYRREEGDSTVNFYMAYYDHQRVGATTHSPANCIPGGGWQIVSSNLKSVATGDNKIVRLSQLVIGKGDTRQLVYYWFDERGRDLTETTTAKWYLLRDAITLHRTDGALIRLVTPLAHGEEMAAAEKRLDSFLVVIYPDISKFVPGVASP